MSFPSLTGSTAVASPALSIASWSAIDDVYQINVTAPTFLFPDPSVTPPNFLNVLAELAEQELRTPDIEVKLEPLDSPVLEWPAED